MVDRRAMRTLPKVEKRKLPGFAKRHQRVAAVDAAKHAPAWAFAELGVLTACGFDATPGRGWPYITSPDVAVLEASRSYGSKDHGKHGDILAESIGGALCAGSMRAGEVVLIAPDEWAGSASSGKDTAKPPRHQAVWEALSPAERALIAVHFKPGPESPAFKVALLGTYIDCACIAISYGRKPDYSDPIHNILDAVGLLLFALGRIGRAGAKIKAQRPRPQPPVLPPGVPPVGPLKLNKKRFLQQ